MIASRLALRNLRRQWRLPELRTLAAALFLAVLAMGTVATLAARMQQAVLLSAAELIGGDAGVQAAGPLPPQLGQAAQSLGLATSRAAEFPSVAFAGDRSQLLSVVAADASWPLRGKLLVAHGTGPAVATHAPEPGQIYLDHRALAALQLRVGDAVQVGGMDLQVAGELRQQPGTGGIVALAPAAVMSRADAEASGLLGAGSRATHRLLVAGDLAAVKAWRSQVEPQLPSDAQRISPERVQQQLARPFARATAFLRLSALLSALLAGIAVALSATRYARRKTSEVALLRALGAPSRVVFGSLLWTLMLPALLAALLGALLALLLSALAFAYAQGVLPAAGQRAPLPMAPALAAAGAGLAVLLGFALPPLARLKAVPPIAVFQRSTVRSARAYGALYLLPLAVAAGLLALQADGWRMAGVVAGVLAGATAFAVVLTLAGLWLIRRWAARLHPGLRLGASALARRRLLSVLQSCAIALGLTALLLLAVIGPALLENWRQELPPDTPNWFIVNLQTAQQEQVAGALRQLGASGYNSLPVAVGKLTHINGQDVAQRQSSDGDDAAPQAAQQLRLTWRAQLPPDNRVVAGQWLSPNPERAEVSLDAGWAQRLGLKPGDTLGLQVGEQRLDARVTSLRAVDWSGFNVNFFVMLDVAHGADLPHTWIASFYLPPQRADALAGFSRDFANLSLIDVDALLDRARDIVEQVSAAARWVLAFSLVAGALVLAAALTMSAAERRHEAALLRTLGASRRQLRLAALCEFGLLGAISALIALLAAAAGGAWLAHAVFEIKAFRPPWTALLLTALVAAVVVALLGLAGTRRVLRTPPLALLRR
ncbi:MAG: FtsX-like permease family protein [Ottowia sp.]